jgi:hypothetical protein
MRVKHIVDTIVNDTFRHKFKWRIIFIHPLPRQIRSHIAGGDVLRGEDQTIEQLDAVQIMHTTRYIWVNDNDVQFITARDQMHYLKCDG